MSQPSSILLITADQLSALALRFWGSSYGQTPNIDRILRRAALFRNAYTNCPLCQPSRASFWTGRMPQDLGIRSNGRKDSVTPVGPETPTLAEVFHRAGYATAHFGKGHAAGGLRGFAHIEPEEELPADEHPAWPINADTRRDRYTSRRAVEFLETHSGKPFFCAVEFQNPHNICGWVGENEGVHEDVPLAVELPPLPANFEDRDFTTRPLPLQYVCCTHRRLAQSVGWTDENYRRYIVAYHHYLQRADAEIGALMDALEKRSDARDVLTVFFADHGDGMAAHRMITKHITFHEECVRVPFAFAGPGIHGAGDFACDDPVSLLDLLPTLVDYAGLDLPGGLQGRSLMPWLKGSSKQPPHEYVAAEWYTEWGHTREPGRMIRTARHKYVRFHEEPGEELYDLENDPGERRNLAPLPDSHSLLDEHRRLLREHCRMTGDPFFTLKTEVDPRWRSHPPGYQNHRGPVASQLE
jgi:choline-sulfatase